MVLVVLMVCMPIRNCPSLASRTELSCADARRKVKSSFDLFSRTFAAIVAELQTLQGVGFIMAVWWRVNACRNTPTGPFEWSRMVGGIWTTCQSRSQRGHWRYKWLSKKSFMLFCLERVWTWCCCSSFSVFFGDIIAVSWLLLEWCHGTKIVSDVLAVLCSTKQSTWESLLRPARSSMKLHEQP